MGPSDNYTRRTLALINYWQHRTTIRQEFFGTLNRLGRFLDHRYLSSQVGVEYEIYKLDRHWIDLLDMNNKRWND